MNADNWHYVQGGSSLGPFTTLEMEGLISRGEIGAQTLVWNETLPVWEPAARHFEMADFSMPNVPGGGSGGSGGGGGQLGHDGLYVGAPSRGFLEALQVCFRKYVTFSGRASRSEYWFFVLWQILIGFVTGFIDGFVVGATGGFSPLNSIASLVLLLPTLAVSWRRLHDIDRSGWWIGGFYLAMIVLVGVASFAFAGLDIDTMADGSGVLIFGIFGLGFIIYSIVMLVFFCTRGTPGPNRYG